MLIVHSLLNQLLPDLLVNPFNSLQVCYRHIEEVHEGILVYRGYSIFLLNMAFISPSEVKNIYIS